MESSGRKDAWIQGPLSMNARAGLALSAPAAEN